MISETQSLSRHIVVRVQVTKYLGRIVKSQIANNQSDEG